MTKNKALYEFMEYLPFLKELVKRDFKMKYYKSFLGVLWTLLNPLILATIMTIIFSTLFKRSIEYYPIYNISGHLILTFFVTATKQSLSSVYHHAGVFRKFKVPQYMYCLSNVTIAFITLLFSSVPMLILALVLGMPLHFTMLLFPLPIILAFIFTMGCSLILAAYGVFFRDLSHLYGIFTYALNFLTPIFYPIEIIPVEYRFVWDFNPLYLYIRILREVFIYNTIPNEKTLLVATCYAILTLALGILVFKEKRSKFYNYL